MTNSHGSFLWYELMTTDPEAAGTFYGDVVGWTVASHPSSTAGGMEYRMFSTGSDHIAGLMAVPPGAPMAPGWFGYITVDDVDAAVSSIEAAGGAVHMPATDIPDVGRMAMVADPQGVAFYVMRGSGGGTSTSFSPTEPGRCSWNELATPDLNAAVSFYTGQFGWGQEGAMPMGDMGDYKFLQHDGGPIGAMMKRAQEGPPAGWRFYFRVPDITAAAERIAVGGGMVLHGPVEVPGGDQVVIAADPQGASFGLVGGRAA